MGLSSHRKRCDCTRARVREEYVDVTMFLFHDGIEPIQIFQARHVAHDRRNVSLDEGCGLLQLFLSSPSDHDVRTFFHEALGRGQTNPAASTRDNRNFSYQVLSMVITHMFLLFVFRRVYVELRAGRSASDLRQAAVDGELAGSHEAAVVGREKGRRRPDLRWIGHALEWSHRGVDLLALLA